MGWGGGGGGGWVADHVMIQGTASHSGGDQSVFCAKRRGV